MLRNSSSSAWTWVRCERGFAIVLLVGALLRLCAMLAYRPILWFNDAFEYLGVALRIHPYVIRPDGYSAFLRMLLPFHSLALVAALQHLMGLTVGLLVYVLLRRWRVPRWLAAIGVSPQLLDVHQIELEHLLLSDTLALFLLACAFTVLLWRPRPSLAQAGVAGLLLAAAALTRTVALPVIVVAAVYLLVRWPGWRAGLAFLVLLVTPLVGYAGWFDDAHGRFALNGADGVFLYSRVMAFADCTKFSPAADVALLCDPRPRGSRPPSQNYIWHPSPLDAVSGPIPETDPAEARFGSQRNAKAQKFAVEAILGQPSDYLRAGLRDFARTFGWKRTAFPNAGVLHEYSFTRNPQQPSPTRVAVAGATEAHDAAAYDHSSGTVHVVGPFASALIAYQHFGWLPGALLGVVLLAGLAGITIRRRPDARRLPAATMWCVAAVLLLVPPFTAEFDYRYVLPSMPFAGAAFGLGVTLLARPRADGAAAQPTATDSDPVPEPAGEGMSDRP